MLEVTSFIKKAGTFYLGTTDDDQPEIRPIGVFQEYDGKSTLLLENTRRSLPRL